jgi:hypothetical protein
MLRRVIQPHLEVRERFETTRISRQSLVDAYARLVPTRCEAAGKARRKTPDRTAGPIRRCGGSHA